MMLVVHINCFCLVVAGAALNCLSGIASPLLHIAGNVGMTRDVGEVWGWGAVFRLGICVPDRGSLLEVRGSLLALLDAICVSLGTVTGLLTSRSFAFSPCRGTTSTMVIFMWGGTGSFFTTNIGAVVSSVTFTLTFASTAAAVLSEVFDVSW